MLPSGATSTSLEEEGWCCHQTAMRWHSKMVAHWQEWARQDWNNVIHFLEKMYGIQAVRVGTAVRFKWSDIETGTYDALSAPTIIWSALFVSIDACA